MTPTATRTKFARIVYNGPGFRTLATVGYWWRDAAGHYHGAATEDLSGPTVNVPEHDVLRVERPHDAAWDDSWVAAPEGWL